MSRKKISRLERTPEGAIIARPPIIRTSHKITVDSDLMVALKVFVLSNHNGFLSMSDAAEAAIREFLEKRLKVRGS